MSRLENLNSRLKLAECYPVSHWRDAVLWRNQLYLTVDECAQAMVDRKVAAPEYAICVKTFQAGLNWQEMLNSAVAGNLPLKAMSRPYIDDTLSRAIQEWAERQKDSLFCYSLTDKKIQISPTQLIEPTCLLDATAINWVKINFKPLSVSGEDVSVYGSPPGDNAYLIVKNGFTVVGLAQEDVPPRFFTGDVTVEMLRGLCAAFGIKVSDPYCCFFDS